MSASARRLHYTYAQYLSLEEHSAVRHEFLDGEIYAMAGGSLRTPEDPLAVANPILLVEITSPSTEEYDRGGKLRHYKGLPSLREVLFVSHRAPHLTLHRRGDPDWTVTTAEKGGAVELASVAARIVVDEVYRDGLEDAG